LTDRFHDSNSVVAVQDVEVHMMDDVYAEARSRHQFRRPYLKIDVQGFDLEVAEGAAGCLGDFVGLQAEASLLPLYAGAPVYEETLAYFRSRGFVPSAFFPVAKDQKFRLIDCDCVFINPRQIRETPVIRY
jgi:hypothetical protein